MKKNRNHYSRLRFEQELALRERREKREFGSLHHLSQEGNLNDRVHFFFLRRILVPNFSDILLHNLFFFLLCFPALAFFEITLLTGSLIFLAVAWGCLMFSGIALCSLYHRAYEYTRRISPFIRSSFWGFSFKNFRPAAAAGLILGLLWILCGVYCIGGQGQVQAHYPFYYFPVLLLTFLVSCYTVTVMAQIAQFDLPLKAVFKNAILLIPSCGWRCALPALLQAAFILVLFQNRWMGLLLFFLGFPNLTAILAAHLLWPKLSRILLKES